MFRHLMLATVLLCAACDGTRTTPTASPTGPTPSPPSVEPFAPLDGMPPFVGEPVPQFAGQWHGEVAMTGCHAYGPMCTRAAQAAHFSPPRVQLTLIQAGIHLSGTMIVCSSDETPMLGNVTEDGGFVVSGIRPLYSSQFRLTGKFNRVSEQRLETIIIREIRDDGRLSSTYRYQGSVTRQQ